MASRSSRQGHEVVVVAPDLADGDVLARHLQPRVREGRGQEAPLDVRGQPQLFGHAAGQRLDPPVEAPPARRSCAAAPEGRRVPAARPAASPAARPLPSRRSGSRPPCRADPGAPGGPGGAAIRTAGRPAAPGGPRRRSAVAQAVLGQTDVQHQEVGPRGIQALEVLAFDLGLGLDRARDRGREVVSHQHGPSAPRSLAFGTGPPAPAFGAAPPTAAAVGRRPADAPPPQAPGPARAEGRSTRDRDFTTDRRTCSRRRGWSGSTAARSRCPRSSPAAWRCACPRCASRGSSRTPTRPRAACRG